MSRRKGEVTPRHIDREYRHQVEIDIPDGGLGTRLNAMYDFCRGLDFKTRGIGHLRMQRERDATRFCFKTAEEGGTRLTLPEP